VLYRYGWIAWIWRILIFGALGGAGALIWAGGPAEPTPYLVAAPIVLPALFFGHVVATGIVRLPDGTLVVTNLLFLRRRMVRASLGRPRKRPWAQTLYGRIHAPTVWIPVRGGLPVYLDLLGEIPDRPALANMFRMKQSDLPRPD
jgi:hypothetical protein